MPLERPEPIAPGGIVAPKTHQEGNRWSTRFAGEKPIPLGTAGGFIYARDLNTGELTTAPSEGAERYKREKAVKYLDEYGEHEGTAYTLTHPWDMLLRYGGAKEFPRSQILAHNWQRFPPVIDGETIEFPQIAGETFDDIDCPFCFRALPSEQGKRNHITVMHADRVAADDLATGVTKGMTAAMEAARGGIAVLEAPAAVAEPQVVRPPEPFICGVCNIGFGQAGILARHYKENHKPTE